MTDPSSISLAVPTNAPSVTMGSRTPDLSPVLAPFVALPALQRGSHRETGTQSGNRKCRTGMADVIEMPISQVGECEGLPIDVEDAEDAQADDDRARDELRRVTKGCPKGAGEIAASLHFSRLFDGPRLAGSLRRGAPVIVIDVADASMLGHY